MQRLPFIAFSEQDTEDIADIAEIILSHCRCEAKAKRQMSPLLGFQLNLSVTDAKPLSFLDIAMSGRRSTQPYCRQLRSCAGRRTEQLSSCMKKPCWLIAVTTSFS